MARIYFPQKMEMHHAKNQLSPLQFDFETEEDYNKAVAQGWRFNKADLVVKEVEKEVVVPEVEAEEPVEEKKEEFVCDICGYKGKSAQSLYMHKYHKHKDK